MNRREALREATLRKARESARVKEELFAADADRIVECAGRMAEALEAGGRLYVMGNGGSACDAAHAAVEFLHPVIEKRRAFGAQALAADSAMMSAVGNDQDFALVYASQLRILARPGDVALGISTSGDSANVNRALAAARELGMLVIGLSGRDGGRMAKLCDYCFVAPSFSIHRIQECHALLIHVLWDLVHVALGEEDVL